MFHSVYVIEMAKSRTTFYKSFCIVLDLTIFVIWLIWPCIKPIVLTMFHCIVIIQY